MSGWIPAAEAVVDNRLCDLRFRDALGFYEMPGPFFLHDDGFWYAVEPPRQIAKRPTHFRPGEFDVPVEMAVANGRAVS